MDTLTFRLRSFVLLSAAVYAAAPVQAQTADADFAARCAAPGVLVCEGFDTTARFTPAVYPNSGIYPVGGSGNRPALDTAIKASGQGSARFTIPSGSGANGAGEWWQNFGNTFAANTDFYVQFRQRFDSNMVNLGSAFGGGGWKQVIFWDKAVGSCASEEITTNNGYYRGFPQMYTACGQGLIEYNAPGSEVLLQYSNPYPPGSDGSVYCRYSMVGNSANKCQFYKPDVWMTFYYHVHVGNWGSPETVIEAWVGYDDGTPMKQIVNRRQYTINMDPGGSGFNILSLTVYDTGKDGRAHPDAMSWYDELIVSTSPIAAPATGATAANPPPARPMGLVVR